MNYPQLITAYFQDFFDSAELDTRDLSCVDAAQHHTLVNERQPWVVNATLPIGIFEFPENEGDEP